MKPQLVSFKLCPFVQRSVIVLLEKGADFDISYIELDNPPDWFRTVSPFGKVPLLRVGDAVLFESAVIMEYLDETHPPSLHPADPLQKALNRAWIEYASSLMFAQHRLVTAGDEAAFDKASQELRVGLERVERQLRGPLFNGADFSLADAAYAPLFLRMALLEERHPLKLFEGLPKAAEWKERLLTRPSVQNSVVEDFPALYRAYIARSGGFSAGLFGG